MIEKNVNFRQKNTFFKKINVTLFQISENFHKGLTDLSMMTQVNILEKTFHKLTNLHEFEVKENKFYPQAF